VYLLAYYTHLNSGYRNQQSLHLLIPVKINKPEKKPEK
jgi:hypothetical protein